MLKTVVFIILSTPLVLTKEYLGQMQKMLDEMQQHYDGENAIFDRTYLWKLQTCFSKNDDEVLLESQENAWGKIREYWEMNGVKMDSSGRSDVWDDKR
jgi:hypothetical protein